jgi:hypothetical protein
VFLSINQAYGLEIVFNIQDPQKYLPERITADNIMQWVIEDISDNRQLHQAVKEAEERGVKKLIFMDNSTVAASVSDTAIYMNLSSLSTPQTSLDGIREGIRRDLCFELANVLNTELMECTHNFKQFPTPETYADAVVSAEANSLGVAKELFTSRWQPSLETMTFFARESDLRDLSAYRKSEHYKRYIQQYLFHTTPGFPEEASRMIVLAQDTLKLFIELDNVLKQKYPNSFDAESKKSFLQGVKKYHDSCQEYVWFVIRNVPLLKNSFVEVDIQDLFFALKSNDECLQKIVQSPMFK